MFFVLSLLIAFTIWLLDNLSGTFVKNVNVPIYASCNLEGYAARSSSPAIVMARCRTTGYDIMRLSRRKKPAVIEFGPSDMHHKEGELFYVTGGELERYGQAVFGDNAGLEMVLTDTLYFHFRREEYKKVPVMPLCGISYAPQYMSANGIKVSPDSVLVYGEPFHLENIDRVYTRHFVLSALDGPANGEVELEKLKEVRLSTDKVQYGIDVGRYVEISTQVRLWPRNVPAGRTLVIYPSVATVTYRCAFPVVGDPTYNVTFYIDYKDFAQSISGKCLPRNDGMPRGVMSYTMSPEVFDCVENVK